MLLALAFVAMLVPVVVSDLDRRVIPDAVLGPASLIAVTLVWVTEGGALGEHLLAGAAAGAFLLVAAVARPDGMGMGDVKLAATMGLFLGRAVAPALAVALLAGAVAGAVIAVGRGPAAAREATVPFGPFLALGGVVGLLAGEGMVERYLEASA